MRTHYVAKIVVCVFLLVSGTTGIAADTTVLEGTWRMTSYLKADNQIRYQTDGYMMFSKTHWFHIMYLNRDERPLDFAEAHHGRYEITGADTLNMTVDLEFHTDPKTELQDTAVWYGPPASLEDAHFSVDGDHVVIDLPSSAQLVLDRIE